MRQRPIELLIPGLLDSGPDHWQTLWRRTRPQCRKVELGDWDSPGRAPWVSRLDRAVASTPGPVVLIAHSLGCHAVAWWAAEAAVARLAKVRGALLVAPPDVDRTNADPLLLPFAPTPTSSLPFRSLLVASRDDPYASFDRSARMARQWGCELVDVGRKGHINASSGLEDWSEGQRLLDVIEGRRPLSSVQPPDAPVAQGRYHPPSASVR